MKNVKHAKCVKCGKIYKAVPDLTNCSCGGILDIVYDYGYIKTVLTWETLAARRDYSMWRYRELLPVEETTAAPPSGWAGALCTQPPGWRKRWASENCSSRTMA